MKFYNLSQPEEQVDFRTATVQGLGKKKGLFFPEKVPVVDAGLLRQMASLTAAEIAYAVMQPYAGDVIPEADLRRITAETIAFDIPLVKVSDDIAALELFHGPTLAFKDVGARFMSRCLGYFMRGESRPVTVLVATSGDTGGAVANGFYGVEGVKVVILFPSGKVSKVQEAQLTTLGKNITALEVAGSFDDCQTLVKQAFSDEELNRRHFLTSANSINVARWLPQQIYYWLAWKQWQDKNQPPVFSVPSGNFGNICAGLLAQRSGLPVSHFIAACNANAVVPDFLQTGDYKPVKARTTLSNAMDVGDPSNFVRILELFNRQSDLLKATMSSESISDPETADTMRRIRLEKGYQLDPHGAVGYLALERWLKGHPGTKGIVLETAHPVKFYDVVESVTGSPMTFPDSVRDSLEQKGNAQKIPVEYGALAAALDSI